jgi:hypothetical protein
VGYYEEHAFHPRPLAERWNGHRWSVQHVHFRRRIKQAVLMGVSCISPVDCMAVGSSSGQSGTSVPLVERWNGHRWTEKSASLPSSVTSGYLAGVSCVSAHMCIAVGSGYLEYQISPLAERWNGHEWSSQKIPGPGKGGLNGVSCFSAAACAAVGNAAESNTTLAERWDGHHWSIQPTPSPGGTKTSSLNILAGVSCPSVKACTAVGYYSPPDTSNPLVEQWNGSKWSVQRPANVGTAPALYGVYCTSAHSCTAVGFYDSHNGSSRPLAEHN